MQLNIGHSQFIHLFMFTAKQLKTNDGFIFIYINKEKKIILWLKDVIFGPIWRIFTIYVFNPLQRYHGRSNSNKKMLGDMKSNSVNMTLAKSFICFLVTLLLSTVAATRDRTCCSYACKSSIDSAGGYTNTCPDWCKNQDSCVLR